MKTQLSIYGILIIAYIVYNLFFKVEDERINTVINILLASVIFLVIAVMAFYMLKKIKKK